MARLNSPTADDEKILINPLKVKLDILWLFVPLMSTVSVVSVIVSISTNGWLHTSERMLNPKFNGNESLGKEYLFKKTVSGLWSYCYTNPGENYFYCKRIDYFAQNYSPDPQDSTLVIPYVVSKSAILFLSASCLVLAAFGCCILGQCVRFKGIYSFISGLLFIFAGLLMLLGLIVYISIFKAEVGIKLLVRSSVSPPLFEYHYGYSFLVYIIGLFSTKISGVGGIFLFMYRVQYHWKRKKYDELKKGNRPPSLLQLNRIIEPPESLDYPCRRHPDYYINSNSIQYPKSPMKNRFPPLPKQPPNNSPCSIHRPRFHQSTSSLKDVGTSFYDFPPPPTISYQFDEHFSNRERAISRDITMNTMNTLSTTADINVDDIPEPYFGDDYSPNVQHEFVTFDLDQPLPIRAPSIVSICSRGGGCGVGGTRKSYDGDCGLRRTTPV